MGAKLNNKLPEKDDLHIFQSVSQDLSVAVGLCLSISFMRSNKPNIDILVNSNPKDEYKPG